jgi:regulator of ribonuclease activity A
MFQPPAYGSFPDINWSTADLCDAHLADAEWGVQVVGTGLHSYGGRRWYFGEVVTAANPAFGVMSLVDLCTSPGEGRVLVADAQGSLMHAVVGDRMAALAAQHGWAGIVVNGVVRDTKDLGRMPLGIHALGTRPNRAADMQPANTGGSFDMLGVKLEPGLWLYADEDGVILMRRRHTA